MRRHILDHLAVARRLHRERDHHQHRRPLSSWTLTWRFSAGQRITQAWNATASQSGDQGHRPQRRSQRRHRHRRVGVVRLQRILDRQQPRRCWPKAPPTTATATRTTSGTRS
nr:cellulose binding domain-containing protein [Thermostaphylospora chromogena]